MVLDELPPLGTREVGLVHDDLKLLQIATIVDELLLNALEDFLIVCFDVPVFFVVEAGRMAVVLVEVFGRESFVIPFEEFRLFVVGDDRKEEVFIRAVGLRQFVVLDDRGDEIVEHHIGNTLLAGGLVVVDLVVQRTDFIVHHEVEVGEQLGCVAAQYFVDQEFVLPVQ